MSVLSLIKFRRKASIDFFVAVYFYTRIYSWLLYYKMIQYCSNLYICDQVVKPKQIFGDKSHTQVVVVGCLSSLEITESIFEAGGNHSSL